MLRVVYEATRDLERSRLVEIVESRGRATVKLRESATASEYLAPLNEELKKFVARCHWFQIWRGRIISADSPDSPLTVQFEPDAKVDRSQGVNIRELGGVVRLHVHPELTADELARVVNRPIEIFLAGGQWFQLWEGEIVTMDSPEVVMA